MSHTSTTTVTVYNFWVIDGETSRAEISTAKATLEKIHDELGLAPVTGTGLAVSLEELDSEGFYRRVPTGWMALMASWSEETRADQSA